METLEILASITRLSDRVVRVLGQNPGKFTLQGTNTYLIGERNPYTLIDTGEGNDAYIPQLESALSNTCKLTNPNEPHISDIVISHWHHDHTRGINSVLSLLRRMWDGRNKPAQFKPPRIHKFPLLNMPSDSNTTIPLPPPGTYAPTVNGAFLHDLVDGQLFPITGSPSPMRVIHTPGHTPDSICLHVPDDRALYTADTVLGQGTAVFADLGTYISSLHRLLAFQSDYTVLYPGHGPIVAEGPKLIGTYVAHRMEREAQIVSVIEKPRSDGQPWSTWGIVSTIYSAYPQDLWEGAAQSVNQHLAKLQAEGKAKKVGGEGKDVKWELLAKL
ncbi:beta-lactamase-like protein [Suillus discolor]|uniref:Beta-lactamase-like protein n=1 Tax=Suillus discolor TaxID=1912936 RepID=A0A9P7F653_9AGAM|nr:beta-lactamase-like protein [Suillus discolor]KAG2107904.1 beta-lactamase-like protein [Suillus discolor]